MKNKEVSTLWEIIILLIVAGGVCWYINTITKTKSSLETGTAQQTKYASSNKSDAKQVGKITEWQECKNTDAGFKISCPKSAQGFEKEYVNGEWIFTTGNNGSLFGTRLSKPGGMIWGINKINSDEINLEHLISDVGSQFKEKRIEKRENITVNGKTALLVTVTVSDNKDWNQKSVYIEDGKFIYRIGNGAIDFPEFEIFYNSFELL
jgi:hypothetical protein